MATSTGEIVLVDLASIDANPHRRLADYPCNEQKLATLMRSIDDVGAWERIIVRRNGNRFEQAFGHHLKEAARRLNLKQIAVIVRDLTDEQMLQFMGRENSEDYNADFLVMLETWEAAVSFRDASRKDAQAIDIARVLGWTRPRVQGEKIEQLNDVASACFAAFALIEGGHLSRADLADMSVKSGREICQRAQSRIEMLERLGTKGKRPRADIDADKAYVGRAAKSVAKDVREDEIRQKDIRGEIDFRAAKQAIQDKRDTPLFATFAKGVADQIHKMLVDDKPAEKLAEMAKQLPEVRLEEDFASLRRVDFALAEHENVSGRWRQRLTPQGKKVVPFKLLKKED